MSVPKKLGPCRRSACTGTRRGSHTMQAHTLARPWAQMGTGSCTHSHTTEKTDTCEQGPKHTRCEAAAHTQVQTQRRTHREARHWGTDSAFPQGRLQRRGNTRTHRHAHKHTQMSCYSHTDKDTKAGTCHTSAQRLWCSEKVTQTHSLNRNTSSFQTHTPCTPNSWKQPQKNTPTHPSLERTELFHRKPAQVFRDPRPAPCEVMPQPRVHPNEGLPRRKVCAPFFPLPWPTRVPDTQRDIRLPIRGAS